MGEYKFPLSEDEVCEAIGALRVTSKDHEQMHPGLAQLTVADFTKLAPVVLKMLQWILPVIFQKGKPKKFRLWDFKRNWKALKGLFSFVVDVVIALK